MARCSSKSKSYTSGLSYNTERRGTRYTVVGASLLVEERISLCHDLRFVQVDDIHRFDWIRILHIVPQNPNHKDRIEATIIKAKIKNEEIIIFVLFEEKILLYHDLKSVQVDEIQHIDWFHMWHVVHQNRDYIYQV